MKKIIYTICWIFLASFASQSILANEISGLEITENDFIIGDENAPITIIEYASMSCSHCADFHTNTLPELKTELLIQVKYVWFFVIILSIIQLY